MRNFVLLSLCSLPGMSYASERPNIIYIFTDQHTASAMSCIGNSDVSTPNIDRLASSGILFKNAYCTSPLSGPSRAAMFTGHYPDGIGMILNGANIPDSVNSDVLGLLMSSAGYECVYGGKWHLPKLTVPDGDFGFTCLHPHTDNGLAESCAEYLSRKHTVPFFLVASFDNPHNICEYARDQNLPYGNIEEPEISSCPGLPSNYAVNPYDADAVRYEKHRTYGAHPTINYTADDWRRYRNAYYRLVEKVDAEIGKIIDAIDRNNLWNNTIVIFSSDHGDGNASHQWNQKSALYEEVVNVPLIVTLPGKKHAGKVLPQLVNAGIDFYASVCDWGGVTPKKPLSGKSFRSIAEKGSETSPHQDFVVTETSFGENATRGWMLRTEKYKYVLYSTGKNREQLFDMVNDRGEMRNLAVESRYSSILEKHRDLLYRWIKENHVRNTRFSISDVPGKPND